MIFSVKSINLNKDMRTIKPKTLKGFRDIFSDEIVARDKVISTIKRVYESFGFSPLATPALEYKEILVGYGEEANKQIYTFSDTDEVKVGLRYDLTCPLSRVMAQYRNIERPFKRYQIQEVWRYDKPDKGRFREFLQFDIDTVGISSVIADAEIIFAMYQSIKALGIDNFKISISNRKILGEVIKFAKIESTLSQSVFRIIDKLERQGLDAVLAELGDGRIDASGAEIRGLGLKREQIDRIKEFIILPQSTRNEALSSINKLLGDCEGIEELREIDGYLEGVGIDEDKVAIDFSIARGLDYYTGPVYEAILLDAPKYGSIMGGGRYDRLIGQFAGEDIPATGASIGVDRLVSALMKLGVIKGKKNFTDVLITIMLKDKLNEYNKLAIKLREKGINTEVYLGKGNIGKQLKYADKKKIPIAIIIGEDEFKEGVVTIKDLRAKDKTEGEIKERDKWLKARMGQGKVQISQVVHVVEQTLASD